MARPLASSRGAITRFRRGSVRSGEAGGPKIRSTTRSASERSGHAWARSTHWAALGLALFALAPVLGATSPAHADDDVTYKYRGDDGTVWYTDRRPNADELDNYEFMGYHGRPPARSSCRGLGEAERQRRADRIERPLRRLSERYGADRLIIKAMISVESCFDPEAVSSVGAQGLMQLMPETARELGVTDPFDIHANLRGGIEYFQRLRRAFPDRLEAALAAYNAGPGAVRRHGGIPPYEQTQKYVRRVLDQLEQYRRAASR